jgi:hypothetical protein
MVYKAPKPTKAQLAEGRARARAAGIDMNQSAKGLRNASKVIIAGASMLPAGRAVKGAATAAKVVRNSTKTGKAIAKEVRAIRQDAYERSGNWATHPGAATIKSSERLQKGKWSTPKQIARYERQEAKATVKGNARGLKAANKPVSKNNRNRFGDGEMSSYLKSAKPARANRTRLGNTTKKK